MMILTKRKPKKKTKKSIKKPYKRRKSQRRNKSKKKQIGGFNPCELHHAKLFNFAQNLNIERIIQKIKDTNEIKDTFTLDGITIKYLGEGTYNTVYRISSGNINLILRYTKKNEESNIDTEMKGLLLQKSLDYVCKIYRIEVIVINGKRCCVAIMEECESVSKIQNKNLFLRHLLKGIDYLQGQGKVHLDIKADNLSWNGKKIKFLDFGCIEEAGMGKNAICMPPALKNFPYHRGDDDEMKTSEESLSAYTMLSGVFLVMLEIFEDGPIIKKIAVNYKDKLSVALGRERDPEKMEKKYNKELKQIAGKIRDQAMMEKKLNKHAVDKLKTELSNLNKEAVAKFKTELSEFHEILKKEEKLFNIMDGAQRIIPGPLKSIKMADFRTKYLTLFMKSIQEEILPEMEGEMDDEMDFLQKLIRPLFLEPEKTHFDKKVMSKKIKELIEHPFLNP